MAEKPNKPAKADGIMAKAEKMAKAKEAAKASASKSSSGTKKQGLFKRMGRYFKDLKGEFKKIVWPTKKQTINNTIVVLVFMVVVAIFLFALDSLLGFGTQSLYSLKG